MFIAWTKRIARRRIWLFRVVYCVTSPTKRNCDSGSTCTEQLRDQENWNRNYRSYSDFALPPRICKDSRETFLRLKAISWERPRACLGRREETKSPRCLRNNGYNGDGIKERWSGLHSGDTSEAISLLAGFSCATSSGCRKKRVQKQSTCIGHRRRRRVDK